MLLSDYVPVIFDIAEMFRDFKAGGYSLEGSKLEAKWLSKLMIVVAYTSATIQGKQIKRMGIQKYVARSETRVKGQRRQGACHFLQRKMRMVQS